MTTSEMTKVYDAIMCIPGMNENVKLNIQISRKQLLLLSQVLDGGLKVADKEQGSVLSYFPSDAGQELQVLVADCLEKAGLNSLSEKLKSFSAKEK